MFLKILFYFFLVILVAGLIGYLTEPKEHSEGFQAITPQQLEAEAETEAEEAEAKVEKKEMKPTNNVETNNQVKKIIQQSNLEGVGNIFSPRITIRTSDNNNLGSYYAQANQTGDGYVIDLNLSNKDLQKIMSSDTNQGFNKSFELQKYKNWKKPETDLWKESFQDPTKDPWDTLLDNEKRSKEQETKNDLLCYNILKAQKGVDTPLTETTNQKDKHYDEKGFYPGYQFVDPKSWDVPQKRAPICIPQKQQLPSAIIVNGVGTNVLELDKTGRIATKEEDITETNVGSILPKFKYQEDYQY